MSNADVILSREGPIAHIAWHNPPEGTLTLEMVEALHQRLDELASVPVSVLLLTGQLEGVFIKHYEVRELIVLADALRAQPQAIEEGTRELHGFNRLMLRLEAMDAITIAALNGTAQGGGFELALACDFRLAADGPYKLGLLETKLGIIPGSGGTQRLAALVGIGHALDIILNGQVFTPRGALQRGLVHRVYPADHFRADVRAFAEQLAQLAPAALAAAKHCVRKSQSLPLERGLLFEQRKFFEVSATQQAADIMRAYVDGGLPPIEPSD